MEKVPHIDLKELEKAKEENFKDRLQFIDKYTDWLKKEAKNSEWSLEQKRVVDRL